MSLVPNRVFLLGALFTRLVSADGGEDFSNNLFSDLAPYVLLPAIIAHVLMRQAARLLALFGERVTMQFMSQSMGWADNIVLAMAPLGIITAIVSAIRVGGPTWLKAIIGRARENLAAAEAELMSSTSDEVCELWNGRALIRCMGSGPMTEFICLVPRGMATKGVVPTVKTMDLNEAIREGYLEEISKQVKLPKH